MLRVFGIARLTRDPDLKYTKAEKPICSLGLAVDQGYGQNKSTCFVDAAAFGKTAEMAAEHLAKGRQILVEDAHLELQTWEKDGVKHRKHCLVLNRFEFVGPRPSAGAGEEAPPRGRQYPVNEGAAGDDEIPF